MSREKALEAALTQIERNFGKGSIMRLGEADKVADVEVVSTGSIGLDMALGIGGLPRGRVIEIYGPESSGKTTLTLHVLAEAQKDAGLCAFIDAEHALDPIYARKLGVDVNELLISQPDTGEQALEIADTLVQIWSHRGPGDRLGCRADTESGTGRGDGRQPARPACAADEPGAAQAHRHDRPVELPGDLH